MNLIILIIKVDVAVETFGAGNGGGCPLMGKFFIRHVCINTKKNASNVDNYSHKVTD